MDTTTLILPKELLARYSVLARQTGRSPTDLMRDALEAYAAAAVAADPPPPFQDAAEPVLPSWFGIGGSSHDDENGSSDRPDKRRASLGIGESTLDDGYDSTNIKDWIRKTWKPE